MNPYIILTADETRQAEKITIEGGLPAAQLMERAGAGVVSLIEQYVQLSQGQKQNPNQGLNQRQSGVPLGDNAAAQPRQMMPPTAASQTAVHQSGSVGAMPDIAAVKPPITILCGHGKNGGDGFVVARLLKAKGWAVRVGFSGDQAKLEGDIALMAGLYDGPIEKLTPAVLEGAGVIVDAILGIGLSRPIEGELATMVNAINAHGAPVIAIDIPTGIHADTGEVMGVAVRASHTLTFVTRKAGHVLYPGQAYCGVTNIAAIGVPDPVLQGINPKLVLNEIAIWGQVWARPSPMTHKFNRGSVMVLSGNVASTGAARLAAKGALRIGAGLSTILAPSETLNVHAAHLTSIMLRETNDNEAIFEAINDKRVTAIVAGPGLGLDGAMREKVKTCAQSQAHLILDADGLSGFANSPKDLFKILRADDVLTPHEGEFARLFPDIDIKKNGRLEAARLAAKQCGAIVVLKGADTIIASPDGRTAINVNAPADLATAGSGDVLAGFIAGMIGQRGASGLKMPAFEAACGGVWLHGACGQMAGPGLIAEDLPDIVPAVLKQIFTMNTPNGPTPLA